MYRSIQDKEDQAIAVLDAIFKLESSWASTYNELSEPAKGKVVHLIDKLIHEDLLDIFLEDVALQDTI